MNQPKQQKKAPAKKVEVIKLDTRGQVTVPLDADYILRPSYEAIEEVERESGLTLFDLATAAVNNRLTSAQAAIAVAAMMRAHGKASPNDPLRSSYLGASAETLGPMIYEAGLPRIQTRLAVLLAGALTGGYTASGEAKASVI